MNAKSKKHTETKQLATQVGLSLPSELWLAFRMACLKRKRYAGREVARIITEQLARWDKEEHA